MATYESDEEQIEALSRWWKENGNSLIIGIVVVLVSLFSVRQWQSSQIESAGMASDLYQQMAEISALGSVLESSDENYNAALILNTQLRTEYANNVYSHYGALLMARVYVEQDELDKAAEELNWILDNASLGLFESADEELFLTARLRLARIVLAQGDAQGALDTLAQVEPASFVAGYAEVQGDAFMSLGRIDEARSAYRLALETATNSALLQLKLDDIGA